MVRCDEHPDIDGLGVLTLGPAAPRVVCRKCLRSGLRSGAFSFTPLDPDPSSPPRQEK